MWMRPKRHVYTASFSLRSAFRGNADRNTGSTCPIGTAAGAAMMNLATAAAALSTTPPSVPFPESWKSGCRA